MHHSRANSREPEGGGAVDHPHNEFRKLISTTFSSSSNFCFLLLLHPPPANNERWIPASVYRVVPLREVYCIHSINAIDFNPSKDGGRNVEEGGCRLVRIPCIRSRLAAYSGSLRCISAIHSAFTFWYFL